MFFEKIIGENSSTTIRAFEHLESIRITLSNRNSHLGIDIPLYLETSEAKQHIDCAMKRLVFSSIKTKGEIKKMFVDFNGRETEKEFLEKCLEQWEMTANSKISETLKVIQLGTVFSEMRHRLSDLKEEK